MATDDVKITMLGTTGAGKTCFMVGMYAMLRAGHRGFTFSCEEDLDLELSRRWMTMLEPGKDRFPPKTPDGEFRHRFSFNYGFRPVFEFEWLDYRGGALYDNQSSEEFQRLKNHLLNSTCVMLCVSGEHLASGRSDVIVKTKCGIDRMGLLLTEMHKAVATTSGQDLPPLVIVITQFDRCRNLNPEKLSEQIRDLFNPAFASGGNWLVAICPVSLGKELAENPISGEIGPYNLHLPVAFATYCVLKQKERKLRLSGQQYRQRAEQLGSNWLKRLWNSDEIESANEQHRTAERKREKIDADMTLMVQELRSIPVYFDGQETDFDV
jgi:double-GTPase-like protein